MESYIRLCQSSSIQAKSSEKFTSTSVLCTVSFFRVVNIFYRKAEPWFWESNLDQLRMKKKTCIPTRLEAPTLLSNSIYPPFLCFSHHQMFTFSLGNTNSRNEGQQQQQQQSEVIKANFIRIPEYSGNNLLRLCWPLRDLCCCHHLGGAASH